jgi:hypothetical protein
VPAPFTGSSIDSEGGSFVNPNHNGQSYAQSFSAVQLFGPYYNDNLISFSLGGTSPGPDNWNLVFGAPNEAVLEPGTYTDTVRYTGSPVASPVLDVTSEIACNQEFGQFTILDATYSAPGVLASFAATFEDHCEGQGPATFGDISYNSTAPFYGEAISNDQIEVDSAG